MSPVVLRWVVIGVLLFVLVFGLLLLFRRRLIRAAA
jgi:hydrogenase/urease accessory protein HupE